MNDQTLEEIVAEIAPALAGREWGKVFQLSALSLAVDFRTGDGRYLLLSAEPNQPRLHLVKRTVRELEKAAVSPSHFALVLRKALGGGRLDSVVKDAGDRIVRFSFSVPDATGEERPATLVAQLTGRTSNLFLLDPAGRVSDSLRLARGEGQEVGDVYAPPSSTAPAERPGKQATIPRGEFKSPSEAADVYYQRLESARAFDARAADATARLRQEISRRRKLQANLARDLAEHGDAEEHKRAGELLLANVGTAERRGRTVRVRDYYAEDAPFVEMEIDEQKSLPEEAAARFSRYTKARRAAQEVASRLEATGRELSALEERRERLAEIVAERDEAALEAFREESKGGKSQKDKHAKSVGKKGEAEGIPGVRRYRSSDGYEILVGRGPRENDHLTFRVARSQDTWLHAADYPGSHVVVRNLRRGEDIPHRTLLEAAQLAARFSRAREDSKVAVNYTLRKFINKPKGAAPGLVYLSSFRTLLVEPREAVERI
ncbi:MAG TPA: NFACT family protein [Pyrinomonadaceae bacterium]|nr:NFACT family protein [Pyrinomonadaceae bacterium]